MSTRAGRAVRRVVEREPARAVGAVSALVGAYVAYRFAPDSLETKAALAAAAVAFAQSEVTRLFVWCSESVNRILGRVGRDGRVPEGPRG